MLHFNWENESIYNNLILYMVRLMYVHACFCRIIYNHVVVNLSIVNSLMSYKCSIQLYYVSSTNSNLHAFQLQVNH